MTKEATSRIHLGKLQKIFHSFNIATLTKFVWPGKGFLIICLPHYFITVLCLWVFCLCLACADVAISERYNCMRRLRVKGGGNTPLGVPWKPFHTGGLQDYLQETEGVRGGKKYWNHFPVFFLSFHPVCTAMLALFLLLFLTAYKYLCQVTSPVLLWTIQKTYVCI